MKAIDLSVTAGTGDRKLSTVSVSAEGHCHKKPLSGRGRKMKTFGGSQSGSSPSRSEVGNFENAW